MKSAMIQRCGTIATAAAAALLLVSASPQVAFGQDVYEGINEQITDIRELELLDTIEVTAKTREQLQQETADDLDEDYPLEEREADQRTLIAFGLMDPDDDIGNIYVDLLGDQVAGYYDPATDEMVVVTSSADGSDLTASEQVTYAHETVHALQDQHFNLETFIDRRINAPDDESIAITALIEGDATVAQFDFLLANQDLLEELLDELEADDSSSRGLEDAPPIIAGTLYFPYEQGQVFVQALRDEGGWDLVNDAFASPPTSTEQILHPEKYLDGEEPVAVGLPDLVGGLGSDWTEFDLNTMGEYQISIVLDEGDVSGRDAERAADGWGGDSYIVIGTDDEDVIVWNSVWDTDDDAVEFAEALVTRESGRLDAGAEQDGDVTMIAGDAGIVRVVTDGDAVSYVLAPDQETIDAIDALPQDEIEPTDATPEPEDDDIRLISATIKTVRQDDDS